MYTSLSLYIYIYIHMYTYVRRYNYISISPRGPEVGVHLALSLLPPDTTGVSPGAAMTVTPECCGPSCSVSLGRHCWSKRYLSDTTPLVLCVVYCVKDQQALLPYSPLVKSACVRQAALDKWFPLTKEYTYIYI